jgi:hypothetical protein
MIDKKRFRRYTLVGGIVESGVLATFVIVSQHAGPHHTWFWVLLFTQMPGVLLMRLLSIPEGRLSAGARAAMYYAGVFTIQLATIAIAVALTLYAYGRIRKMKTQKARGASTR